jgi:hypothetical protein
MANEFISRNGLIAKDNSVISGSLIVTAGVTGSFTGSFKGDGSQLTGLPIPPPSIRRHDFTGSYSYCGTADSGSAESSPVWDITRITFQPSGTGSISEYAYDVTWTGRYTHIYT